MNHFSREERERPLQAIRYVNLVIPEENWDQKRSDMHEYHIDTFVMGDDWQGQFDFLRKRGQAFSGCIREIHHGYLTTTLL